ncbi:cytochrome-b5 reductase [Angomonas deanei]|uniref:NADH-cytochrome b5 reductase n=1 Tax=Angomonas deanei TaxID=59799 RepID=A0A7G2CS70_9TRYP|nr:cytochrome-b5 reductase [Angomonas deanei]CAD2221824.1 Oxidoreductase FAD-binding domain/Ferric reductase NAD binding domain/Oxidoreductase NAD-binding domain containing protein, putative [Angomonas deanei]|eukprot:EPY39717.1 cytochrome-b5 reductase [Angomonas deanei]
MSRFLAGAFVGLVGGLGGSLYSTVSEVSAASAAKSTFNPDEFQSYKLLSSRYESHDTRRFLFALPNPEDKFHMPVASCIVAKFTDSDGKEVVRPYTPITSNQNKGYFELLIKKYPKGKMGNHLFTMQVGEELLMKGPFEKFSYTPNQWKHVGMICGGTGIAPMYQVVKTILENPKDKTNISLLFANNQRRDILLANELMELQKTYNNFNVYLTLLQVPSRWLGGIGYINKEMIQTFMPKPGEKNTKILVCGPPPMLQAISGDKLFQQGKPPQQGPLSGILRELGYTEDQVFKY